MEHTFDPDFAERYALSAESAALARTLDDPRDRFDGVIWHAITLIGLAEYEEFDSLAVELDVLARSLDLVRRADAVHLRSHIPRHQGDLAASVRAMDETRELLASAGLLYKAVSFSEPAATAIAQGRFGEGCELLAHLRTVSSVPGDVLGAIGAETWVYRWVDDPDAYRRCIDTASEESTAFLALFGTRMGEAVLRRDQALARQENEAWRPLLAFVPASQRGSLAATLSPSIWSVGDTEAAEAFLAWLRPHEGSWVGGFNFAYVPADLAIGINLLTLGRPAEAEPLLRGAVESAERAPAVAWEALGRQFLALALLDLGRHDDARLEAARCVDQATALGMHRLVRDLADAGLGSASVTSD